MHGVWKAFCPGDSQIGGGMMKKTPLILSLVLVLANINAAYVSEMTRHFDLQAGYESASGRSLPSLQCQIGITINLVLFRVKNRPFRASRSSLQRTSTHKPAQCLIYLYFIKNNSIEGFLIMLPTSALSPDKIRGLPISPCNPTEHN